MLAGVLGCQLAQPLWKSVWLLLAELEVALSYKPTVFPKDSMSSTDTRLLRVHCCSIHHSQEIERAQRSISWSMSTEDVVCTHGGTLFSLKEKIKRETHW